MVDYFRKEVIYDTTIYFIISYYGLYMAYTLSYLYKRTLFIWLYSHCLLIPSDKTISSYLARITRIHDRRSTLFKYGLNAFLIGDIACLFFYYHYQPFTYIELIVPVVSMILLEIVTYSKDIDYKTEITSYIFALVWLTSKSILTAITMNTLNFKMMALGFILYLLSDVLLVFYKRNKYQILGILNIFFYYFGIFLTAYSFSFI